MTKNENKEYDHVLSSTQIRPIQYWEEWLRQYQEISSFEMAISLLHCGFDVSFEDPTKYSEIDRLIFYFNVADNWQFSSNFISDDDTRYITGKQKNGDLQEKTIPELCQMIARKAFDMLCLKFFKIDEQLEKYEHDTQGLEHWWESEIMIDRLFQTLQHFFRAKDNYKGNIRVVNLSSHDFLVHNEKHTVGFLLALTTFIFQWEEEEIRSWGDKSDKEKTKQRNTEMRTRIDQAKPWIIEILSHLNKLNVLEVSKLDLVSFVKLNEIAFRSELIEYKHPVKKTRKVVSIDEACYAGSEAGWLVKQYELWKSVDTRLEEIKEAEFVFEEAKAKIEKLSK